MSKLVKKIASCFWAGVICALILGGTVFAYNPQSVACSFDGDSGGHGGVDGSSNGKYYSLNTGNVTLVLTNKLSNIPGTDYTLPSYRTCNITLFREQSGTDKDFGVKTIEYSPNGGTNTTTRWIVDADSSKYYLYITGGQAYHYDSQGTFYDYYY